MDNIPSEQLKNSGEATTTDSDMPEDLGDEGMADRVDTIARHTFTEEW